MKLEAYLHSVWHCYRHFSINQVEFYRLHCCQIVRTSEDSDDRLMNSLFSDIHRGVPLSFTRQGSHDMTSS